MLLYKSHACLTMLIVYILIFEQIQRKVRKMSMEEHRTESKRGGQVPTSESWLRKKLFLFPGFNPTT